MRHPLFHRTDAGTGWLSRGRRESPESPVLDDGSRVAVIGGGPAGSFFSYFLLLFAERLQKEIEVDIYEPRNFSAIGPAGCNMCGGIISESLVQMLAAEGINLPVTVVQRGLDSYVLCTEGGTCRIRTPSTQKRIAAVHRGGGPRGRHGQSWESFDGHLLNLAVGKGAKHIQKRVTHAAWNQGKPEIQIPGEPPRVYDLLVGATGINSPDLQLFEQFGFGYKRPSVAKTYITELSFGAESITKEYGDAVHIFLLNIPELDFAALIPKGDYVTVCMLGHPIDRQIVSRFFAHPSVRRCFPEGWQVPADACHCSPKMFLRQASHPFADRVVLIGDSGTSRLFKDGVGAAYRTAKAAARTAIFSGISAGDFRRLYMPECRSIQRDNRFGRLIFAAAHAARRWNIPARVVLETVRREQARDDREKRWSQVLWDIFTGSARYRDVFLRCLHPGMIGGILMGAAHVLWRGFEEPIALTPPVSKNRPQGSNPA